MEEPRNFVLVVAACKNLGIGYEGTIPWKIPEDLKHFKSLTLTGPQTNTVIMGRKTWESIPSKYRPLPSRKNIIVSKTLPPTEGVEIYPTLTEAISASTGLCFIIGGTQIFQECLSPPLVSHCSQIYLTRISNDFKCDVFLPATSKTLFQEPLFEGFSITSISKTKCYSNITYDFCTLCNNSLPPQPQFINYPPHEEYQYLDLIKEIISNGNRRDDRTHIGTISLFGKMMRFDLSESFPLLTTKLVFWKGVVEELLWFIKGSTNAKELSEKGVKIWDGNGSRPFLDSLGFNDREEGDLGPVYGFQWRHFGAEYKDMHADYSGQGFDQIAEVINLIKTDPNSRRIILSAWNPIAQPLMALPPCHVLSQFYVNNGKLSCMLYQRSGDVGLGIPFNIASYSLLTCLIAQVCGLERGEFVHVVGDTHVYSTHVDPLETQLKRNPYPFPQLKLNGNVKEIDQFSSEDIELIGYYKHGRIQMEMAL
ncbi:unnamed protein product [Blepharisma stoltei]|uniref:Bifunctional dihydrofolate reductase-thymidylate synthase n=1 Tax=Blepharisma stoltei TaxID=1481888 RepID=A0AAU9JCB8_9CILI|nr:unnamed protein product [Blepharisma stoltei]